MPTPKQSGNTGGKTRSEKSNICKRGFCATKKKKKKTKKKKLCWKEQKGDFAKKKNPEAKGGKNCVGSYLGDDVTKSQSGWTVRVNGILPRGGLSDQIGYRQALKDLKSWKSGGRQSSLGSTPTARHPGPWEISGKVRLFFEQKNNNMEKKKEKEIQGEISLIPATAPGKKKSGRGGERSECRQRREVTRKRNQTFQINSGKYLGSEPCSE